MNKPTTTLLLAIAMLLMGEVALQVRTHVKFGTSVLNAMTGDATYQFNEELGLKLLRPSASIVGSDVIIVTNSLGLRSPEIVPDRPLLLGAADGHDDDPSSSEIAPVQPQNGVRIAIVGASTVMGAYTRSNEQTFPYVLQRLLRERYPGHSIDVINAGIAGFSLADQQSLIERLLSSFDIDLIILYTGFNDIGGYCRAQDEDGNGAPKNHSLHAVGLPHWVLSYELLLKNTLELRTAEAKSPTVKNTHAIDTAPYEAQLISLVSAAKQHAEHVLIATNARSFRREMPHAEQMELSTTARYYNDCFDLDELHDVYDEHNAIIQKVAMEQGIPSVPMHDMMPPGRIYFGDATHFSPRGEEEAARILAELIERSMIVD